MKPEISERSGLALLRLGLAVIVIILTLMTLPGYATTPGIVVANTGGRNTAEFRQWQIFRRNVDEKSGGALLLDYLIFGELGGTETMLQAVIDGRADLGSFGCARATSLIPELGVTGMPYLFNSQAEADFVFDKYLFPLFSEIAAQRGLILLKWIDYGWIDLYTKEPVQFPAQLDGKVIRTVSNIAEPVFLRALKALPVEIGTSEIASSSQAGKIFGGVGGIERYSQNLKPFFKYYVATHHAYNCGLVVANPAWFNSATPQEQAIMRSSFMPDAEARKLERDEYSALYAGLSADGTMPLELTAEQHNAWAAAGLPLYPQILQLAGGRGIEVYDAIRAGKQAYIHSAALDNGYRAGK